MDNSAFDYPLIAADFLRALRGTRSQTAFVRRMGYRSNVSHNWENARSAPTAAKTMWLTQRCQIELNDALTRFFRLTPAWVGHVDLGTPQGVSVFMRELKGQQSLSQIADNLGKSRFTITRWLNNETEPKLPDFFHYIEATSLRLLDFLSLLIDPTTLPSVRSQWKTTQLARQLAYSDPWTLAVLRVLEMPTYFAQPHCDAWIGAQLGLPRDEVTRCLRLLQTSEQVTWSGTHYHISTVHSLDVGRDRHAAQGLRAWWGHLGSQRVAAGASGMVYSVFGIKAADLPRLRTLQKNYLTELRNLVRESEPVECVVLAADMLVDLGEETEEA